MTNEQEQIIIKKAQFYFSLNMVCHVKMKPTGFRNGKFISEFNDEGQYILFQDLRENFKPERIFIFQIFDIKDYEVEVRE